MEKKYTVCIAGGGSRYTPGILDTLAAEMYRFPIGKIILYDIEEERQDRVEVYGKILMNVMSDGIVLTQDRADGTSGSIALGKDDIEKLAKGLFFKKNEFFQSVPPQKATVAPAFSLPVVSPKKPASYMEQEKMKHKQAYSKWTDEEEKRLTDEFKAGMSFAEMATLHDRGEGAIKSRLIQLGLITE